MKAEAYLFRNEQINFVVDDREVFKYRGEVSIFLTKSKIFVHHAECKPAVVRNELLSATLKSCLRPCGKFSDRILEISFRPFQNDLLVQIHKNGILAGLQDQLGEDLRLQLEITGAEVNAPVLSTETEEGRKSVIFGKEMKYGVVFDLDAGPFCFEDNFTFPKRWQEHWGRPGLLFSAKLSLKVCGNLNIPK